MTTSPTDRLGVALEVPPAAHRGGFVSLHEVQAEQRLTVGQRVEFTDEGGDLRCAEVVGQSVDRLGRRWLLRMGPPS